MIRLYRTVSSIIAPALPFWLKLRQSRGKEHISRMVEKLGEASLPRPEGTVVWIHAASVGESLSVLPLIRTWLAAHPDHHILITTVTVTSAALLHVQLPPRAFHQFAPVDAPKTVQRFLAHWRPDIALWVESELWPNLIQAAAAQGTRMMLINGRMSERSFKLWQRMPGLIVPMLTCFHKIFAQSSEDAKRFSLLGAPQVIASGNLKYDAPPLNANPNLLDQLERQVAGRTCWLAASTHPGEEETLMLVHRQLQKKFPDLLTIIVPRHAIRGDAIALMVRSAGLKLAERSKHEIISPHTDVYLADTMGELGLFYRLTDVVFMGGSLVAHGGQNLLEPARLDCAIITGPHMHNFVAITREFEEANAIERITDAPTLAARLEHLLSTPQACEALKMNAKKLVEGKKDVVKNLMQSIEEV